MNWRLRESISTPQSFLPIDLDRLHHAEPWWFIMWQRDGTCHQVCKAIPTFFGKGEGTHRDFGITKLASKHATRMLPGQHDSWSARCAAVVPFLPFQVDSSMLSNLLRYVRQSLPRRTTSLIRSRGTVTRQRTVLAVQQLEDRTMPAAMFSFLAGTLSVSSTFNDDLRIARLGLNASLNGIDTGIPVATITSLAINPNAGDGPGENLIDMRNVTLGANGFPALASETLNGGGDNDTFLFDFSQGVQIPSGNIIVNGGAAWTALRS